MVSHYSRVLLAAFLLIFLFLGKNEGQLLPIQPGLPLFAENASILEMMSFYFPTVESANDRCRNHSLYYREELKKLKLWATEMFDASAKMPSGVLYGSSYDFGNFDECVELIVPYTSDDTFTGQYCMAKFTIVPPANIQMEHSSNYYEKNGFEKYYNESMWNKLVAYSTDKTKGTRNELYFGYCLPSSCSYEDLNVGLQKLVEEHNRRHNFKINVEVNRRNCQVRETLKLDVGDILFIVFVVATILWTITASIYDHLVHRDDFSGFKFEGKLHRIILCFSFPRNYKNLVSKSTNSDGFNCMAGMKVYSMILIILMHRIMFVVGSPMLNPKYAEQTFSDFKTSFLLNGPILVETFFTISGFLAAYLILTQLSRSEKGVNLLVFYLHRVVRMTPIYAVILAFYCTLLVKIGSGPLWQERVGLEQERCRASWWANLLYINTYVNTDKICMFQSWYVTCDVNFFLFAPVLAWLLWKKPKLGVMVVVSLITASTVTVFVIVYKLNTIFMFYIKALKDPVADDVFKTIYIPGHMRASSYFIGILVGYFKFHMKTNDFKLPRTIVTTGWILCVPVMFVCVHTSSIFYLYEVPPLFTALYASLYPVAWSICISWMLIAISSGHGPWIEPILSWHPLVVLGRLSYSVFISHGAIQIVTTATMRTPTYANMFLAEYQTAADVLLAYCLAFTLSMLYESPLIGLERVLLSGHKDPATIQKLDDRNVTSSTALKKMT